MFRFRRMKTLQELTSFHANVQNHCKLTQDKVDIPTCSMLAGREVSLRAFSMPAQQS